MIKNCDILLQKSILIVQHTFLLIYSTCLLGKKQRKIQLFLFYAVFWAFSTFTHRQSSTKRKYQIFPSYYPTPLTFLNEIIKIVLLLLDFIFAILSSYPPSQFQSPVLPAFFPIHISLFLYIQPPLSPPLY